MTRQTQRVFFGLRRVTVQVVLVFGLFVVLADAPAFANDQGNSKIVEQAIQALRNFNEAGSRTVACRLWRELNAPKPVAWERSEIDRASFGHGFIGIAADGSNPNSNNSGTRVVDGYIDRSPNKDHRLSLAPGVSLIIKSDTERTIDLGAVRAFEKHSLFDPSLAESRSDIDLSLVGKGDSTQFRLYSNFDVNYAFARRAFEEENEYNFPRTGFAPSEQQGFTVKNAGVDMDITLGGEFTQRLGGAPFSPVFKFEASVLFDDGNELGERFTFATLERETNAEGSLTLSLTDSTTIQPFIAYEESEGAYRQYTPGVRLNTNVSETDLSLSLSQDRATWPEWDFVESTTNINIGAGRQVGSVYVGAEAGVGFKRDNYDTRTRIFSLGAYAYSDDGYLMASVGKEIGKESGVYPKDETTLSLYGSYRFTPELLVEFAADGTFDNGSDPFIDSSVALAEEVPGGRRRMRVFTEGDFRSTGLMLEFLQEF